MDALLMLKEIIQNAVIMYFLFFVLGIWYGNFKIKNKNLSIKHIMLFGLLCGIIATIFFYFNYNNEHNILVQTGVLILFISCFFFEKYSGLIVYGMLLHNRLIILHTGFNSILLMYLILLILLSIIDIFFKQRNAYRWFIMMSTSILLMNVELVILKENLFLIVLYNISSIIIGTSLFYVLMFIKENNNLFFEFYKYSTIDFLTKLYNRRKLETDFSNIINEKNHKISIAFFDLDYFKNINDSYGHNTGDFVLKTFSSIMQNECNENIKAYRLSGEEFCIIFLDNETDEVKNCIINIQKYLKNYHFEAIYNENNDFNKEPFEVTVSIGLVHLINGTIELHSLIEKADKAMYEAKNMGRNTLVEYFY